MGEREIRHVRDWATATGTVTNKFHQGLPEVDERLQPLRKEEKNFAICYAMCVKWLIDHANDKDFWRRIYDERGQINKEVIDKLANRQLRAGSPLVGEVRDMKRRFKKHQLEKAKPEQAEPGQKPVPPPRRDAPGGTGSQAAAAPTPAPRPAPREQLAPAAAAGNQLAGVLMRSLRSTEPVFQTIRISLMDNPEAAGHMLAAVGSNGSATTRPAKQASTPGKGASLILFDPNFGEFRFTSGTNFFRFFTEGLWPVYIQLYGFDAFRVRAFRKGAPQLFDAGN